MEKKVLRVDGMSCQHCKMSVEKALRAIGVQAAVDLDEKKVTIEYDPAGIDLDRIRTEIEEQGYDVVE